MAGQYHQKLGLHQRSTHLPAWRVPRWNPYLEVTESISLVDELIYDICERNQEIPRPVQYTITSTVSSPGRWLCYLQLALRFNSALNVDRIGFQTNTSDFHSQECSSVPSISPSQGSKISTTCRLMTRINCRTRNLFSVSCKQKPPSLIVA